MGALQYLIAWYEKTTKPDVVNFRTMFLASFFAKGNILLTQIVGAMMVAAALFLGDDWSGALSKFVIWYIFVVVLCALAARRHQYFSFVELDKGVHNVVDRIMLAFLNFILVAVWAITFLDPRFGLLVSAAYGIFSFFFFAPSKDKTKNRKPEAIPEN